MEEVASTKLSSAVGHNVSRSNALYGSAAAGAAHQNPDPFSDRAAIAVTSRNHADLTAPTGVIEDPTSLDVPSKKPFYRRRWFIIASVIGNCVGIAFLFVMLFPVVKAIIQDVVDKTAIDITTVAISNPTNTSFQMLMQGTVIHTGIFSAVISFPTPINISWLDGSTKVPLGYTQLSTLYARNKQATINDTTTFYLTDQQAFSRFMSAMITSQNFTWQLENYDLTVQAEKFPTAHGISFDKLVTVNGGIDNFSGNVQPGSLELPGGNPVNGINFTMSLGLNNPSPFTFDVGALILSLSYEDIYLGNGTVSNANLFTGYHNFTTDVVLVPQTTASGIAAITQIISNYLSNQTSPVLAIGNPTTQPDGSVVSWLSQGIESLTMTIPF